MNPNAKVCHSGGVMFHVCRRTSEVVRTRLNKLRLRDDAKGTGCHNGQSSMRMVGGSVLLMSCL